jgi:hypothetical protein
LLSIGGRVVLLNSVLSSIPIYWMSFYKSPATIRTRIDKLCRHFLWYDGNTVRKKIALVSWKKVCRSRKQRGLGVIDIELMNKALLIKLLIRIKDPLVTGWWKQIILHKYPNLVFSSTISPFMKGLLVYKNILDVSIDWKINNGKSVAFWIDR